MRPTTDLAVVVTDAQGITTTLDSHASNPGYRPMGLTCGSQQGSGFYTGGFHVSWPLDKEHPALHLRDKVQFIGANGEIAYEGFITDLPRSTDENGRGTLTVTLAGYMADTGRATFREIFVDRDLSQWTTPSLQRRIVFVAASLSHTTPVVVQDDNGAAAISCEFTGPWNTTGLPVVEALYSQQLPIGSVYYEWSRGSNVSHTDTNWTWSVYLCDDDVFATGVDSSPQLRAAGPGSGTVTATTTTRTAAMFNFGYNTGAGGDSRTYGLYWRNLAVYGTHGLPLIGSAEPKGVAASEVIALLIARYCPKLNTDGVQDTTYPIAHLAFRDRTTVYDALLKVNSFHLWQLAVWENGTLHFGPVDMRDWDWEIRHDDPEVSISLQGDSVENLRNGIIVSFTNVATGTISELHPDDHAELRDDALDNPYNLHGDTSYGEPYTIPFPTTEANALELGRLKLLEDNQVKAPGSITVQHQVRDRAGVLQPAWKIRSGQKARIVSSASLSDRPRLIHEVSYSHDSRTATIAVDSTLRYLEGFVDRMLGALAANNVQV